MVHHATSGDLAHRSQWLLWLREFLHSHLWKAVGILLVLIVVGQLVYPSDRGLPQASVNGTSVKLKKQSEIIASIEDQLNNAKVLLAVGQDKTVEVGLKSLGAAVNTDAMVKQVTTYPLWQRFIPGSVLWQGGNVKQLEVTFNDQLLRDSATAQAALLSFPSVNAKLTIKNDHLETINAVDASSVNPKELADVISHASYGLGDTVRLEAPATRTPAKRVVNLDELSKEAEAVLNHTVKITVQGESFVPDKTERASWIKFSSAKQNKLALSIDSAKVKNYLASINKKVGKPAGVTNVKLVDGRETSRKTGAKGRGIDVSALSVSIIAGLKAQALEVALSAEVKDVAPSVKYNNHYTASQAGLQAYVTDMARQKNMHIIVQQARANGWYAGARAGDSIPSASTYKLYIALMLFDKINKGQLHWNDKALGSLTVSDCLERMIVYSANECAEKWIKQWGARNINNFVYAKGFSRATNFLASDATHTSATDLHKFLVGLKNGSLISGSNRTKLLNLMNQQIYRNGIPSGSVGGVFDKVGFLWDYNHDAAIVDDPHGSYTLVIMSKGQSFGAIANVAREIRRIMYP